MKYCLDTNSIIYYLKGSHPAIRERLQSVRPKDIYIPEIVYAELLYDVSRSQQKAQNAAKIEAFVKPFARLPFDAKVSPHYANIRTDLAQRGDPIGPKDVFIAAITRAHSMALVTNNTKEFGRVAGLTVEDWTRAT
ncbi:MAG: type II toxin-antitoxin system VapC family toxin [Verrucomicrobiota bacterium]